MKSLIQHITEKLIINKNFISASEKKYHPITYYELQDIITEKSNKLNQTNGYLDLSDIDTSDVDKFVTLSSYGYMETITDKIIVRDLKTVNVYGWETSHITNMEKLFSSFYNLTEIIGLETWDIKNVINMTKMFAFCDNLEKINIENWKINHTCKIENMFSGCYKLKKPNWYK